jgi:inorganic pyrophosphatase
MNPDTGLVVVEIPKGSRNKYEFDEGLGMFKLDRMLFSSCHYPAEHGYIREAWGEDDDPLDALVITGEPTFCGCAIEAKPLGLFEMKDEEGIDSKILFTIYKELEGKKAEAEGWHDQEAALAVIGASRQRFAERKRGG